MQEIRPIFDMKDHSEASFGNTDWWTIRQASRPEQADADPARCSLYKSYWNPVFQFILRSGYPWHDAEDLTQEFFSRLLEHNSLRTADQEKGKFRSFLLTLLKRFLSDQRDRARCKKRGGGSPAISLDGGDTEFRRRIEPRSDLDPERICERHWVDSLIENAFAQLEQECALSGKSAVFRKLKTLVADEGELSYADAAAELHMSDANVRVTVHRLRRRLRQILSEEVDSGRSTSRNGQDLLKVYAST